MPENHVHAGIGSRGTHTYDEIMKISHATLAAHGSRGHSPQGGYSAKYGKSAPDTLAKSNMPRTYPEDVKTPLSEAVIDRMTSGIVFEDKIGKILAEHRVPGEVVVIPDPPLGPDGQRTAEGKAAKERATFEAYMDPKVKLIFNARLARVFEELISDHFGVETVDEDRVSEPDAIELGPVMANGLRAMRFVDVKDHKVATGNTKAKTYDVSPLESPFFGHGATMDIVGTLQLVDWMQLAHYYRHGRSLGLCDNDASLWGAVIGREEVLVWSRIDEAKFQVTDPVTGAKPRKSALEIYDTYFSKALDIIDNAMARDLDPEVPALTAPEWFSEMEDSEWRDVTMAELLAHGDGGHITLLPGLTPARAMPFYHAGITSIGDLARLSPNDAIHGVKDVRPYVFQARVAYHDQVVLADEVIYLELDRADIEVDFDYEADDLLYQRGVRITDRTGEVETTRVVCIDDFSGTEAGEMSVFVQMWELFTEVTENAAAAGHSVRFYHYSHYEKTADRKVAEKYAGQPGVPSVEQVEGFYDSDTVIDMYPILARKLMWPTRSHSIKSLAKYVGFSWPEEGQNGAESMVWYRHVRDGAADADEMRERLRGYNGADTEAQLVLREWVTSREATNTLVGVHTLAAPAEPPVEIDAATDTEETQVPAVPA